MSEHVSHETNCLPLNIEQQIAQRHAGLRKNVHHNVLLCSCCLKNPPASETDRYCKFCRAAKMVEYRKKQKQELGDLLARLAKYEQQRGESTHESAQTQR